MISLSPGLSWLAILAVACAAALCGLAYGYRWLDRQEQQDYADLQRRATTSYLERQRAAMAEQRVRLKRMRRPYDWSEGGEL